MSQRNPMNERYTTDAHKGVARKSAASAKPKTKAASSVTIKPNKKTPQEKKVEERQERRERQEEQRRIDRMYYKPDTQRYKNLRRMWWVCLICAVILVTLTFTMRSYLGNVLSIAILVGAYVFIIAAFYIDFSKIRKERRAYQERMVKLEKEKEKEERKTRARGKGARETASDASEENVDQVVQEEITEGDEKQGMSRMRKVLAHGFSRSR